MNDDAVVTTTSNGAVRPAVSAPELSGSQDSAVPVADGHVIHSLADHSSEGLSGGMPYAVPVAVPVAVPIAVEVPVAVAEPPPQEPAIAGEKIAPAGMDVSEAFMLDLALGVTSVLAEHVPTISRQVADRLHPVTRLMMRPPLVGERLQPGHWVDELVKRGRAERPVARARVDKLVDGAVPELSAEFLPRVDRAALISLVEEIIDDIDLPEIIRQSTGSMASETVRGARMQAIAGDEAVARLVDKLMPRRKARATTYTPPPSREQSSEAP